MDLISEPSTEYIQLQKYFAKRFVTLKVATIYPFIYVFAEILGATYVYTRNSLEYMVDNILDAFHNLKALHLKTWTTEWFTEKVETFRDCLLRDHLILRILSTKCILKSQPI